VIRYQVVTNEVDGKRYDTPRSSYADREDAEVEAKWLTAYCRRIGIIGRTFEVEERHERHA